MSGETTGEVSGGDITAIVDFLFGTGTDLPCLEVADANQSGAGSPTGEHISVGDISAIVDNLCGSGDPLGDCL